MQISGSSQQKDFHSASPQPASAASSAFSLTNMRRHFILLFHLFFFNKVGFFPTKHSAACSKKIRHVDLLSLLLQIE